MVQKWILNASPLILLHKIDFLETMSKLSETWLIPEAVAQEIRKKRPIQNYVTQLSVESDVDILNPPLIIPSIAAWDMGLGESEVLCHALEMGNAGVIVWAKKEGIIDKLKPHFDNLVTAGIRIDENLMKKLLRTFGES